MCVDRAHLVEEALGNAGNHVLDHRLDSSQASDVLSSTVPNDKLDSCSLVGLDYTDVHVDVLEVLQSASVSQYCFEFARFLTLTNFPRGPSTVTCLALMATVTFSGTARSSSAYMSLMLFLR